VPNLLSTDDSTRHLASCLLTNGQMDQLLVG
jgi:hypothetical protein